MNNSELESNGRVDHQNDDDRSKRRDKGAHKQWQEQDEQLQRPARGRKQDTSQDSKRRNQRGRNNRPVVNESEEDREDEGDDSQEDAQRDER